MPKVTINGIEYELKQGGYGGKYILILDPKTNTWKKLRVYAITYDEGADVYVMPIKAYLTSYDSKPSYLGALPNLVGGVGEWTDSRDPIAGTLKRELSEETHGKYKPGSKLQFVDLIFTDKDCFVFLSAKVKSSGTSVSSGMLTDAMREMTGEHFRFAKQDLIDAINRVKLTEDPTVEQVKQAILALYKDTGLPVALRKKAICTTPEREYDLQLSTNKEEFMERSHAIDALARHLQGEISTAMKAHAKQVVELRKKAGRKAFVGRMVVLLVIVLLLGILFFLFK